jgi:pimeloyl-ACP methyl ester carboxylesterase
VTWGERDRVVPIDVGHQIVDRIKGARLVVVPGAGHNPMWEQPDIFNREVISFLTRDQCDG